LAPQRVIAAAWAAIDGRRAALQHGRAIGTAQPNHHGGSFFAGRGVAWRYLHGGDVGRERGIEIARGAPRVALGDLRLDPFLCRRTRRRRRCGGTLLEHGPSWIVGKAAFALAQQAPRFVRAADRLVGPYRGLQRIGWWVGLVGAREHGGGLRRLAVHFQQGREIHGDAAVVGTGNEQPAQGRLRLRHLSRARHPHGILT